MTAFDSSKVRFDTPIDNGTISKPVKRWRVGSTLESLRCNPSSGLHPSRSIQDTPILKLLKSCHHSRHTLAPSINSRSLSSEQNIETSSADPRPLEVWNSFLVSLVFVQPCCFERSLLDWITSCNAWTDWFVGLVKISIVSRLNYFDVLQTGDLTSLS